MVSNGSHACKCRSWNSTNRKQSAIVAWTSFHFLHNIPFYEYVGKLFFNRCCWYVFVIVLFVSLFSSSQVVFVPIRIHIYEYTQMLRQLCIYNLFYLSFLFSFNTRNCKVCVFQKIEFHLCEKLEQVSVVWKSRLKV